MRAFLCILLAALVKGDPCPSGFGDYSEAKCYRRLDATSFTDCSVQCRGIQASMVCIESEVQNTHVFDVIGVNTQCCSWSDQSCCAWIGLSQSVTDQGTDQGWDTWDKSGCTSSLRLWAPSEPNDFNDNPENCAVMGWGAAHTWFDTECDMRAACLCEKDAAELVPAPPPPPPLPPSPSPPPSSCRPGWVSAPGEIGQPDKCYKVLEGEPKNQRDCAAGCHNAGGSSICVSSAEENEFVSTLAGVSGECCNFQDQSCCLWLGLTQSVTELDGGGGAASNWDLWDSGCNSAFRNWQVGEPNNDPTYTGAEDCSALTADLFWYDTPCEMEAACMCETGGAEPPCPEPRQPGGGGGGTSGGVVFLLLLIFSGLAGTVGFYEGKDQRVSLGAKALLAKAMGKPPPQPRSQTQPATVTTPTNPLPTLYQAPMPRFEGAATPLATADSAAVASAPDLPMAVAVALPDGRA